MRFLIYDPKQNKMADQLMPPSSDQNVFTTKRLHNRITCRLENKLIWLVALGM